MQRIWAIREAQRNTDVVLQPLGSRQGVARVDKGAFELYEGPAGRPGGPILMSTLLECFSSFRLMLERDQRPLEIGGRLTYADRVNALWPAC